MIMTEMQHQKKENCYSFHLYSDVVASLWKGKIFITATHMASHSVNSQGNVWYL